MSVSLKLALGAILCLIAGWVLGGLGGERVQITFLSVGQGDCAVIQQGAAAILIDAGPSEGAAKWQILPKLRALGVSRVDTVLLSHADTDHIAGVPVLARQFPSARFAISEEFKASSEWMGLVSKWHLGPDRLTYLPSRMAGTVGTLRVEVYCPPLVGNQDNDASMFVRFSNGSAAAVFSGDATAESEVVAAASGDWNAELMKAGHHGSRTSTSFTWLSEVMPTTIVVSCGKDNRYGHPAKEMLERATGSGAKVLRTDQDGDLRFELQGGHFVRE